MAHILHRLIQLVQGGRINWKDSTVRYDLALFQLH